MQQNNTMQFKALSFVKMCSLIYIVLKILSPQHEWYHWSISALLCILLWTMAVTTYWYASSFASIIYLLAVLQSPRFISFIFIIYHTLCHHFVNLIVSKCLLWYLLMIWYFVRGTTVRLRKTYSWAPGPTVRGTNVWGPTRHRRESRSREKNRE